MNPNKRVRGAVSVFLVIVLVPCILVTSVFVDLGRVFVSKSSATSSADLALNTLLTNYDADLNDWYGMIASCQNIEEFYEISAEFFLRTISSQGLSDDEIILLSDFYANCTNDDTIYDFLKVECLTETDKIISAVEGADLSEPTLIKEQIVEFMKYRAPIELATGLFGKLMSEKDNSLTSEANAAIQTDKNDEMVQAKQDFYEAEGELMKAAYESYYAIVRVYYKAASELFLSNEKLVEYQSTINQIKEIYAAIHNRAVEYLFNSGSLKQYSRVTANLHHYNYTPSKIATSSETVGDEKIYYVSDDKVKQLMGDLESAIEDFKKAKKAIEDAGTTLMKTLPGSGSGDANAMQWWYQMNQAINSDKGLTHKYEVAAYFMLDAYKRALLIEDCLLESEKQDKNNSNAGGGTQQKASTLPRGWEDDLDDLLAEAETLHAKYLVANVEDDDLYLDIVNTLEDVSKENYKYKNASNIKVTVAGKTQSVQEWLTYTSNTLSTIRSNLQSRITELTTAIYGSADGSVPSIDDLVDLVNEYEDKFDDYERETFKYSATEKDDPLRYQEQDEVSKLELEKSINRDSANELKTRLLNIRSQLQAMVDAIDAFQYGGMQVRFISGAATFVSRMSNGGHIKASDIPLTNKALAEYAEKTFPKLVKTKASDNSYVVKLSHTTDNNYNPDINPEEDNTVNTPNLLVLFHKRFKDVDDEQYEEQQKDEEEAKKAQENYQDEKLEAASKYRGEGGNVSSSLDSSSDAAYNSGMAFVNTLAGLATDLIGGRLDSIRDDIYVATYIMEMFSYSTYDREAMYKNLLSDEEKSKVSPLNNGVYSASHIVGSADEKETFLSTDYTDTYNKSLTNHMINKENNLAYLAEIEYILYGQNTNAANLKKAYGDIYAIRFVLNTVSGFQHFWPAYSSNLTAIAVNRTAEALSVATAGIIPVPVFKVVIIPILVALETAMDNSRLSYGLPVELYKSKDDMWWISLEGGVKKLTNLLPGREDSGTKEGEGANPSGGLFYSDYLTLFVYSGLAGGGAVEKNMYIRIAEVIQANMNKVIKASGATPAKDFSMKNARVYFTLKAQLRVEPLMLALPMFEGYNTGSDDIKDFCTYEIRITRGY